MMHLLTLSCPHAHQPPALAPAGPAASPLYPPWPQTLHRFPLHLWGLPVPSAGREDTIRSVRGTVRSHGAGGYTNAKRYYFPGAEAEA